MIQWTSISLGLNARDDFFEFWKFCSPDLVVLEFNNVYVIEYIYIVASTTHHIVTLSGNSRRKEETLILLFFSSAYIIQINLDLQQFV